MYPPPSILLGGDGKCEGRGDVETIVGGMGRDSPRGHPSALRPTAAWTRRGEGPQGGGGQRGLRDSG